MSSGLPGLKEQGVTNCVMFEFIRKYNELFLESGERSPYDEGFQLVGPNLGRYCVGPRRLRQRLEIMSEALEFVSEGLEIMSEALEIM